MLGGKLVSEKDLNGLVAVGKVRDAHGLKGELFLVFYAREAPWINQLQTVTFVQTVMNKETKEEERKLFEYPRKRFKEHKIGAIVKVDGIEDRDQSEFLRGAIIYIPAALLTSRPGEMVYLREVLGFAVTHEDVGAVGIVAGFSSNGAQDLLVVHALDQKNQFEIPFVENFVTKIDWSTKTISMSFPSELMETMTAIPVSKPNHKKASKAP